jgi:DNA-directed RNA polymerase specialized sigma24 family protein
MAKNTLRHHDDEELLRLALEHATTPPGADAALELLGRWAGRVYAFCFRITGGRDAALELARSTLLEAARALTGATGVTGTTGTVGEGVRSSGWLFALTRRRVHGAARAPALLVDDEEPQWHVVEAGGSGPPRLAGEGLEPLMLGRMRHALEPREQDALALRCLERAPVVEVARLLRIPGGPGAAREVLRAARAKLRAALEEAEAAAAAVPASAATAPCEAANTGPVAATAQPCIEPARVPQVLALPEQEALRQHVATCPRCRALALQFASFEAAPGRLPAAAQARGAEKQLAAALTTRLRSERVLWTGGGPAAERLARRPHRRLGRVPQAVAWSSAGLLMLVAGVIAAMTLLHRNTPKGEGGGLVLWGDDQRTRLAQAVRRSGPAAHPGDELAGKASFPASAAESLGTDRWVLHWDPVDGADAYQVLFYGRDKQQLAETNPVAIQSLVVGRDQLGAAGATDSLILWQVVALHGGGTIASSRMGTISLR